MKQRLEDAKIRVAQLGSSNAFRGVRHQGLERFHENEPDMNATGVLRFGGPFLIHKIFIDSNYIDINILQIKQNILP